MIKVALVDDQQLVRQGIAGLLSLSEDIDIIWQAENGEHAQELLEEQQPQVMLLDIRMPKMNGIEFLNILKSDDELKYIPIVIMSSSDNYLDVKECYKIGIAGYIIKPLHFTDYSNRIVSLLNYWSNNELSID